MTPNRLKVLAQPTTLDNGAAVAIERAMPRLMTAVFSPFMMRISLGLNHCISNGPVAVYKRTTPSPKATRNTSMLAKFGATADSTNPYSPFG